MYSLPWPFCLYWSSARSSSTGRICPKIHGDGTENAFVIQTDAETLRAALDQENLIDGTESEYGIYILTVDGETADEDAQQWWSITQDGEMTMYGADDLMIADGDRYELTLVTGW